MPKRAYVSLNDEGRWALFAGDGSEDFPEVLAVGDPFEPGESIRAVMEQLEYWASENDYVIVPPDYSKNDDISLDDLTDLTGE